MNNKNLDIAKSYYNAMSKKRADDMIHHLSENIVLKSPLGTINGKAAAIDGIHHFIKVVNNININNAFSNGEKIALNLDFCCDKPFGDFPSIVILTFDNENKIINSELFYETTPFEGGEFDV